MKLRTLSPSPPPMLSRSLLYRNKVKRRHYRYREGSPGGLKKMVREIVWKKRISDFIENRASLNVFRRSLNILFHKRQSTCDHSRLNFVHSYCYNGICYFGCFFFHPSFENNFANIPKNGKKCWSGKQFNHVNLIASYFPLFRANVGCLKWDGGRGQGGVGSTF